MSIIKIPAPTTIPEAARVILSTASQIDTDKHAVFVSQGFLECVYAVASEYLQVLDVLTEQDKTIQEHIKRLKEISNRLGGTDASSNEEGK